MFLSRLALASGVAIALAAPGFAQVIVNRIDDFQNGTTQSWANGPSAPDPLNIATGGPMGAGDRFLQITADGAGPGGKIIAFNQVRWNGNYVAAGVATIAFDLKVISGPNLAMRIALRNTSSSGFSSTNAFGLPADSSWHHAVFTVGDSDLTAIGAPGNLNTFLQNVFELRVLHASSGPTLTGDQVVAQLGVDNIIAMPVPEPSSFVLAVVGIAAVRRRRSSECP